MSAFTCCSNIFSMTGGSGFFGRLVASFAPTVSWDSSSTTISRYGYRLLSSSDRSSYQFCQPWLFHALARSPPSSMSSSSHFNSPAVWSSESAPQPRSAIHGRHQ